MSRAEGEFREIWIGPRRRDAVLKGLSAMLQSGLVVVNPAMIGEQLFEEWFKKRDELIGEMLKVATDWLYGLGTYGSPLHEEIARLMWLEALRGLGKETVEKLGFLWFVDGETGEDPDIVYNYVEETFGGISEGEMKRIEKVLDELGVDYISFPF